MPLYLVRRFFAFPTLADEFPATWRATFRLPRIGARSTLSAIAASAGVEGLEVTFRDLSTALPLHLDGMPDPRRDNVRRVRVRNLRGRPLFAQRLGLFQYQLHGGVLQVGWVSETPQDAADDDANPRPR